VEKLFIDKDTGLKCLMMDEKSTIENLNGQLITLYETPNSDLAFLNINHPSITEDSCFKLLVSDDKELKHLLLFKYAGSEKVITILNECIRLTTPEIKTVCNTLFNEFGNIKEIVFPYLFLADKKNPKTIYTKVLDDSILELPDSVDVYMKSLSKKTRQYFRYYKNRIAKEMPGFSISFIENEDITYEQVSAIVNLNRERMKTKGKKPGIDDTDCEKMYRYARINGLLCLCYDNETIIGGTICSVIGKRAFIHVVAHDDSYQKYSIGQTALINTIQYLIEHQKKYAHLMWGESEYKHRLHCQMYDLYAVKIFRGQAAYGLHAIPSGIVSGVKSLTFSLKKKLKKNKGIVDFYRKILKKVRYSDE
jgi:hypothetical protein